MSKSAPEPELVSPIPLGPESNGEVAPGPRTRRHDVAEELYRRIVDEKSQRLGMSRRQFIDSSCGTIAALWVLNQVSGCGGGQGGGGSSGAGGRGGAGGSAPGGSGGFSQDAGFEIPRDVSPHDAAMAQQEAGFQAPKDALEDQAQADAIVMGNEFIFDVQVHNSAPKPPWNDSLCAGANRSASICPTEFMREIFVLSDTSVACLSGFPRARASDEPSIEARARFKQLLDMAPGSPRLLIHANVRPNDGAAELDAAELDAKMFPVAAWKTYPGSQGGALDAPALFAPNGFYARIRQAGVKLIAAHRGIGGTRSYTDPYSPRDVVNAAKMNPDLTFLVYHAGYDTGYGEPGPYNEQNPSGIDRLIRAMKEFGVGPSGNVYAELGSTWRALSSNPIEATHALGKMLLHLGPDRILWGTDSVLSGGPRAQIEAFRAFRMNEAMRATFGYPDLTPEVKRKILGLNAARAYGVDPNVVRPKLGNDDITKLKLARADDPRSVPVSPHRPHGPRTWREYLAFRRWESV